jgi:competence protein ComEC
MVDALKNNFLLLPAITLAVLLYVFIPVQTQKSASFVFKSQEVSSLECRLLSAPVKVGSKKKSYMVKAELLKAFKSDGGVSSANGVAQILLPLELCEIYQPGKLYSSWRGKKIDFLLDKGARCVFKVREGTKADADGQIFFNAQSVLSCSFANDFFGGLQKIRALSRLHFTRLMYAWGCAGGLLLALLTGSRSYLEDESAQAFKLAGLSHILALSGMHLSLFSSIAFALGKRSVGKRLAPFLELCAICLFVWFAGKSPSLFRALLCSAAAIIFGLLRIPIKSSLNLLALVFIVHICAFPADMYELSFMLSYGALTGILAFNEFVTKPLLAALPSNAGKSLGQSVGAQALTMPICARFLGTLAPGGILSSAVVSQMVSIFIYLGLAFIIISFVFPFMAPICGGVLSFVYGWIKRAVLLFSMIPCVKL